MDREKEEVSEVSIEHVNDSMGSRQQTVQSRDSGGFSHEV